MSVLQDQAVQLINTLSDENVKFLIDFIQRFMHSENSPSLQDEKQQAFSRLNAARDEIWRYLPQEFDPEQELEEARRERYESAY